LPAGSITGAAEAAAALAIDANIGLSVLATVVHAYPTQAGAIKRAADTFVKSRLKPPPIHDISGPAWPVV
jgi:hypothetical protein